MVVDMRDSEVGERLLDALEMWADGVTIMRENLRRRSPLASDAEIEQAVSTWLEGTPVDEPDRKIGAWPRRR
jgi:hypothetical protein